MSIAVIEQTCNFDDKKAVRALVDGALGDPATTRIVIRGGSDNPDVLAAAVLARLMIAERLDVEVAYIDPRQPRDQEMVPASRTARPAERSAWTGNARAVPLIRDDAATVLLGRARQLGEGGAKLHGETYVDNTRLFSARHAASSSNRCPRRRALVPGLITCLRRCWATGRAAQTGGSNLVVEREGVLTDRVVKRSTFYRHHIDLLLVLP